MNKLLVQYINNKFINNIQLSATNFCDKLVTNTSSQLYKIYYQYEFSHAIFIDSMLTNEEMQFVEEFGDVVDIYVYKDADTQNYKSCRLIKGVLSETKFDDKIKIIKIPKLVNHDIYHNNDKIVKNNDIICFLDNFKSMPSCVDQYLYPKSKLPIKLFNNQDIIHPQNIGLVSEIDKAYLMQQSLYYLAIDDYYVPEAWACGCGVLSIEDLDTLKPSKYKYSQNFQSYSNFLKGLLSAKK